MNELDLYVSTWIALQGIMLTEKIKLQSVTYTMKPFTVKFKTHKTIFYIFIKSYVTRY